jgi:hypothetical protein
VSLFLQTFKKIIQILETNLMLALLCKAPSFYVIAYFFSFLEPSPPQKNLSNYAMQDG